MRRSLTRIWEWPLLALFLRPYRCRSCRRRSYKFSRPGYDNRIQLERFELPPRIPAKAEPAVEINAGEQDRAG